MTNAERRDAGLAYIADKSIYEEVIASRRRVHKFNHADPGDLKLLQELMYDILGKAGKNLMVNQPFACDYGRHIEVGDNFFANYGCTILDVGKVTIGSNVLLAPNVSIYTAGHPVHHKARNTHYEYGLPVTIGDNCWIGGSVVILPGVNIGSGCVIGAGSVVVKDIPDNSVAVGNPCRVVRKITDADKEFLRSRVKFDPEAWEDIVRLTTK